MTRDEFQAVLDLHGFAGRYNFLYLPWDWHRGAGLGYAFVNFTTHEFALSAGEYFNYFDDWGFKGEKICEVWWSEPLQGLEEHVERYRNSPVMHPEVPEECEPLLFIDGVCLPFP